MTIKTICVAMIYSQIHQRSAAFDYALDMAADNKAHLSICLVVPVIIIPMDYPAVMIGTVESEEDDHRLGMAKEQAEIMRMKAATNGVTASIDVYQSVLQSLLDRVASASRVHDISITQGLESAADFQSELVQTLLSHSGGPIIIVPQLWVNGSGTKNIIVAWDESEPCARALRFAACYLKPITKVEILIVEKEDEEKDKNASHENPWLSIASHLAPHFTHLTVNTIPLLEGSVGNAIHNHANLSKADLIVMGAYGHSKIREWIFGSATSKILNTSKVPLFMAH